MQRRELEYLSRQVSSVEINGSFYSLQRPESYRRWRDETPEDFLFAVKGGRFISHMKRLRDVEEPLARFFGSGVHELEDKLGPVLWQLPPTLPFDPDLLAGFFDLLPRTSGDRPLRHALEVRHASFTDPAVPDLLRRHDIALVVADAAAEWPFLEHVTSDFMYVRLHGDTELYASGYTDEALDRWARRVREWTGEGLDVFAYFDNDMKVRAPADAIGLSERLGLR
ncbi:uncharacterized protein YecE (DUF72 family) [Actinophytocola oryzae]|uniref:Uncharacterized protein YecE (DUF72 family) n=1 Tax=Actinophytocola oryzae TaxID=502181 RepID=A0A4R7W061_9PSEU|nr:uncharacterized protein YecE (DUF72 family) [Actinophytocola oryzae]